MKKTPSGDMRKKPKEKCWACDGHGFFSELLDPTKTIPCVRCDGKGETVGR